jgi:hypothetical protein
MLIFLRFAKGSRKAAHKEHVAKPMRLVDGFEIRPAPKKLSQWMATMNPVKRTFKKSILEILNEMPFDSSMSAPMPKKARKDL